MAKYFTTRIFCHHTPMKPPVVGYYFSSSSFAIHLNLLHPQPSLFLFGLLSPLWCFPSLVNYYFEVSFDLKVTLCIAKTEGIWYELTKWFLMVSYVVNTISSRPLRAHSRVASLALAWKMPVLKCPHVTSSSRQLYITEPGLTIRKAPESWLLTLPC